MNDYEFQLATYDDLAEIISIYHRLIGTPGCTWNFNYPSKETAESDIKNGCLYTLKENNKIVANKAFFLDGYKNVVSFTDEQLSELPLMRRLVNLQEYSTLLHVMSEPVCEKPEWMIALIEKLEFRLKMLENVIVSPLKI
jgi:hypothetical protein